MWWGTLQGPKSPPDYIVRLISENDSIEIKFKILQDPRMEGM